MGWLRRMFTPAPVCGWCGAHVAPGEGFRPLLEVYCDEGHAVSAQAFSMP